MANLKSLRLRIKSVASTKKMTQAMKLVAASKLRKARDVFEQSKPYREALHHALVSVVKQSPSSQLDPILLGNNVKPRKVMFILFGSDRGLCGSFNSGLAIAVKRDVMLLHQQNVVVEIVCVGKKIYELVKEFKVIVPTLLELKDSDSLKKFSSELVVKFSLGEFDRCEVYYNKFISLALQKANKYTLIPLISESEVEEKEIGSFIECVPHVKKCLKKIVPQALCAQVELFLVESKASEHSARMTSMDNATRNAEQILKRVNITYNRTRQANVTKELLEIISGADAIKSH